MRRPKWQIIATLIAAVIGAGFLLLAIFMASQPAGRGEVGAILHGGFIALAVVLAAIFAGLTVWFLFWRVKWLRWIGILALVGLVLFAVFGRQVQSWLIEQRMERIDAQIALQSEVEAAFYDQMRALVDDPDAGVAMLSTYAQRMNERDLYDGDFTEFWNDFGVTYTIYALVFFDHTRPARYSYQEPPFRAWECRAFDGRFGDLVNTPERRLRAARACPEIWAP